MLGAHAKVPLEALFLETGTVPIRFILKTRRLCYLKTILKRDSEELIREVYEAQKADPIDGDFFNLVAMDASEISLNMSEDDIILMKEEKYKLIVKNKVRQAAFNHLQQLKAKHSKMDNLIYEKLEMSKYMSSPMFDFKSVQMLFAIRTRTVRTIKNDFSGMYPDVACPLGCGQTDTLPNILTCPALQVHMMTDSVTNDAVKYEDVFSPDVKKQKQVTELYRQLLEIRENQLKCPPAALTGPLH